MRRAGPSGTVPSTGLPHSKDVGSLKGGAPVVVDKAGKIVGPLIAGRRRADSQRAADSSWRFRPWTVFYGLLGVGLLLP